MTEIERRDLVVSGVLPRNQLREYLYAHRILWSEIRKDPPGTEAPSSFTITATADQWEKINEWIEQTKVER